MTEEQPTQTKGSVFINLLIGAVAYSAFGSAAALLWSFAASTVPAIPVIGLLPFLALWWVWVLFCLPNMILFVSIYQALNPLGENKNTGTPLY